MKLSVEIVDNKFIYDYSIGETREHGEMPLTVTGLDLFCSIIQHFHKIHAYDTAKEIKEMECKAYIEKHPEVIDNYIDKVGKKKS